MKWEFDLFSQDQLVLVSLLSVVVACDRSAPRYEPEPINANIASVIISPNYVKPLKKGISNDSALNKLLLDTKPKNYKNSSGLDMLLKDLDWGGSASLNVVPHEVKYLESDFSKLVETYLAMIGNSGQNQSKSFMSNTFPNKLSIFFDRNRRDGSWDKRTLVGVESMTIGFNSVLPDRVRHVYSLIGFLAVILTNNNKNHLITFVKLDQDWNYYNNDGTKVVITTADAMHLASTRGTVFFYLKIR